MIAFFKKIYYWVRQIVEGDLTDPAELAYWDNMLDD
jgi:hypothetical protein